MTMDTIDRILTVLAVETVGLCGIASIVAVYNIHETYDSLCKTWKANYAEQQKGTVEYIVVSPKRIPCLRESIRFNYHFAKSLGRINLSNYDLDERLRMISEKQRPFHVLGNESD